MKDYDALGLGPSGSLQSNKHDSTLVSHLNSMELSSATPSNVLSDDLPSFKTSPSIITVATLDIKPEVEEPVKESNNSNKLKEKNIIDVQSAIRGAEVDTTTSSNSANDTGSRFMQPSRGEMVVNDDEAKLEQGSIRDSDLKSNVADNLEVQLDLSQKSNAVLDSTTLSPHSTTSNTTPKIVPNIISPSTLSNSSLNVAPEVQKEKDNLNVLADSARVEAPQEVFQLLPVLDFPASGDFGDIEFDFGEFEYLNQLEIPLQELSSENKDLENVELKLFTSACNTESSELKDGKLVEVNTEREVEIEEEVQKIKEDCNEESSSNSQFEVPEGSVLVEEIERSSLITSRHDSIIEVPLSDQIRTNHDIVEKVPKLYRNIYIAEIPPFTPKNSYKSMESASNSLVVAKSSNFNLIAQISAMSSYSNRNRLDLSIIRSSNLATAHTPQLTPVQQSSAPNFRTQAHFNYQVQQQIMHQNQQILMAQQFLAQQITSMMEQVTKIQQSRPSAPKSENRTPPEIPTSTSNVRVQPSEELPNTSATPIITHDAPIPIDNTKSQSNYPNPSNKIVDELEPQATSSSTSIPATQSRPTTFTVTLEDKLNQEKVVSELFETIEQLENDLSKSNSRAKQLQVASKELHEKLAMNRNERDRYDKINKAKLDEANNKLGKVVQDYENLSSALTTTTTNQYEELKSKYRRLKAKYLERIELDSARIDSLEKENSTLSSRLEKVLEIARLQEQQIKSNDIKLLELSDSSTENEKLRKFLVAAESKISKLFVEKDAVEYKLKAKDYDIRYFREQNEDLKLAVSQDYSGLKLKISSLENQLRLSIKECSEIKSKSKIELDDVLSLSEELLEKLETIARTKGELANAVVHGPASNSNRSEPPVGVSRIPKVENFYDNF